MDSDQDAINRSEDRDDVEPVSPAVQAKVDAALRKVDKLVAADRDLIHGDVVEMVAVDCSLEVAVALCQQSTGFLPDTVRQRLFHAEHADTITRAAAVRADQAAEEEKSKRRSARAAATRAATLAAEAAVASAALKSSTCSSCFQVRAPSGVCGCD